MTAPDVPADPPPSYDSDTRTTTGLTTATAPANDPPPWSGREILVAVILVFVVWPGLVKSFVYSSGFGRWLYGPGVAALANPTGKDDQRREEPTTDPESVREKDLLRTRLDLWTNVLAFPLQAATVPLVFYILSGVTPARIGLTTHRLGRNALSGLGAWLLITPLVFGINLLVAYLTKQLDPQSVQEHPLTRLATAGPTRLEWVLIILSAVVIAPLVEEPLFRGVLQPWFAGFRNGGAAAMAAAFAVALTFRATPIVEALRHRGAGLLTALMPAIFVLALVPFFYLSVARRPPRPESPAVFGTALLFASVHAAVWPTPVPLFVLGLALGMLAVRTGSLVGPMVLHGLFNSVTCVLLLSGWVTG